MGGSEEAVYYTSIELAKLGYEVVVYAGVTDADHGLVQRYAADTAGGVSSGSVTWLHYDTYDPSPPAPDDLAGRCEVFIAWRYALSLGLARNPRRVGNCGGKFLWLHDLIPGTILPPSYFLHFAGILVQSAFHHNYIVDEFRRHHGATHAYLDMNIVRDNVRIVPNGLIHSPLMDGMNDNNVFIYASSPSRGLALVLSQWRTIKEHIPDATLEIYYGFTESVMKELRQSLGGSFDAWWAQMQRYLEQDGVHYIGTVGHDTLTAASARAGTVRVDSPSFTWVALTNFVLVSPLTLLTRVSAVPHDLPRNRLHHSAPCHGLRRHTDHQPPVPVRAAQPHERVGYGPHCRLERHQRRGQRLPRGLATA
jgi:glycosyltransferase involved in cell wall biosynthesis